MYEWELGSSGKTVFNDVLKFHGGTLTCLSRRRAIKQSLVNAAGAKASTQANDENKYVT